MSEMPSACGAVVDLRGNGGGDMGPMLAGVSSLLPDGTVLSFQSRGSATPVVVDGSSVTGGGTPTSAAAQGKFTKPVAVLTDGGTGSSGEATLLSFRGLDYARTFGSPTAGYASSNSTIEMPDGGMLMLTVAKSVARTGEEFAEEPIAPDVQTAAPMEEAKRWLSQECGKAPE